MHGEQASQLCDSCEMVQCFECQESFFIQKKNHHDLMTKGRKVLCNCCQSKYRKIVYRKKCANNCGNEITLTYAAVKRRQESGKNLPMICEECRKKGDELITVGMCQACGKEIRVKRYQFQKYPDSVNTEIHKECLDTIYSQNRCKVCGECFCITYREKSFFNEKRLELPKKCKDCRKIK